jgi:hypothetical protein
MFNEEDLVESSRAGAAPAPQLEGESSDEGEDDLSEDGDESAQALMLDGEVDEAELDALLAAADDDEGDDDEAGDDEFDLQEGDER